MIGVIGFSLERSFMGFAFKKESQLRNFLSWDSFLGYMDLLYFLFRFYNFNFYKASSSGR